MCAMLGSLIFKSNLLLVATGKVTNITGTCYHEISFIQITIKFQLGH